MDPIQSINRINLDVQQEQNKLPEKIENFKEMSQGDQKEYLISESDLKQVVDEANEYMIGVNAQFNIMTHEKTKRTIVQLIDIQTKEIIKEYPPREMLDVIGGIWEQAGILVDRTE